MVDEGLAMSIGASKSSIARSNDVALSIPEFDVRNFWREASTMSRVKPAQKWPQQTAGSYFPMR